jgi:DNA-binding transcriptional LysR family regulator
MGLSVDISIQQLRMLREVSHRGTIVKAARSLGYTPSAVSQQLSSLERATQVAVLEKVGRNVRLTDAGRELVRHAESLLSGIEAAQVAMERTVNEVRGELSLTVHESVAATLLAPLLARLADHYPELQLRTRQLDPEKAIDAVAVGHIDLAFGLDYRHAPAPPRNDIVRFSVAEDRFHLVVPDHMSDAGPIADLADYADVPFISSPPMISCGRCVLQACHDAGFEPDIVHQLDDYPASLKLVASGFGVSLIPDLGLVNVPAGVRVLELARPLSRTIQLVYRTTSAERPAIAAVRESLLGVIGDLGLPAA